MHQASRLEVSEQRVELLPPREALALVNLNGIVAANTAAAVNALTVDSNAFAAAGQFIFVSQR